MKTAKITYSNGDTVITSINGTDETIKKYFAIGNTFNIGSGPNDNMQKVVKCEILKNYKVYFYGRTLGAIGIFYHISDSFEAFSLKDLFEQVYKKYEHISKMRVNGELLKEVEIVKHLQNEN